MKEIMWIISIILGITGLGCIVMSFFFLGQPEWFDLMILGIVLCIWSKVYNIER
ncbi:MAG: hypothetical protein KKF27_21120 [Gammaproteobacteria bacterium]|nr:hypothetical protein [Gammaproteobacteria bacterium]